MKKIFEKINFRQPKYMLPAILYIPLLGASYFIFDLFHTETADIPDKTVKKADEQEYQRTGRADRRQRLVPQKAADDKRVPP